MHLSHGLSDEFYQSVESHCNTKVQEGNEFHQDDEFHQRDNPYYDVQQGDKHVQMRAFIKVIEMHSFKLINFLCVEIFSRQ